MSAIEEETIFRAMQCVGKEIKLFRGKESNLERDEYGSIIKSNIEYDTLTAFPIEFSPTQKQLEKAGIIEKVDVVIYLSKFECDEKKISYEALDTIRQQVEIDGINYKIKSKNLVSQFGENWLYITIGVLRN